MTDEQAGADQTATEAPQGGSGRPHGGEQAQDDQGGEGGTQRAAERSDDGGDRGVREAQRLRQRARTAEAERDALRERVERYQREHAERIAADQLAVPADLWRLGEVELSDLLGEGGEVDEDAVREVVDRLAAERPQLAHAPRTDFRHGQGKRGSGTARQTSWQDILSSR